MRWQIVAGLGTLHIDALAQIVQYSESDSLLLLIFNLLRNHLQPTLTSTQFRIFYIPRWKVTSCLPQRFHYYLIKPGKHKHCRFAHPLKTRDTRKTISGIVKMIHNLSDDSVSLCQPPKTVARVYVWANCLANTLKRVINQRWHQLCKRISSFS